MYSSEAERANKNIHADFKLKNAFYLMVYSEIFQRCKGNYVNTSYSYIMASAI